MQVIQVTDLHPFTQRLFEAAGASKEHSSVVTDHLVEASLAGVDSHGIMRVPEYIGKLKRWKDGEAEAGINPRPKIRIFNETETTAMLDGDRCFGQVCAARAIEMAIQKARTHNVGVVTGRNTDHIGRAAAYPLVAAEAGMVGLIFVKVNPVMVPHGGVSRLLGNNPISVAIPTGGEWPIFVDVAMSVVAGGKILIAMERGESIPEGWAIDSNGNPTKNPRDYIEDGALLPVGQHKGYALAVMNEVLGGLMSGAGALFRFSGNNAFMCMVLNIRAFAEPSDFRREVRQMIADIKGSTRASRAKEILIPGEPEFLTRKSRMKMGIPVPDKTWADILNIGSEFNLQFEGSAKRQEE